jgi:hypothetical protein
MGVAVFARTDAKHGNVGGLKAYQCKQYAHIFFVKAEDVEMLHKFASA